MRVPAYEVAAFRRSRKLGIAVYIFGAILACVAAEYIIKDDPTAWSYAGLAVAGSLVLFVIVTNWRTGVYFLIAWLLFEDLARKFLGNNMAIYFLKDGFTLAVIVSFFAAYLRKRAQSFRPPFLIPLLLFVWLGVMQVFNPASPNIVFGLMGLKLYYFYIPLLFIGYALIDSEDRLRLFFIVNLVLADVIASLGIVQSIIGPSFLNPAVPSEEIRELSTLYRIAPLSGSIVYRPTSVFVSDGRFGSYMTLTVLLAFGFCVYVFSRSRRWRFFSLLTLAILSVAVVLTGSRGALLWSGGSLLVASIAFLWGAPWSRGQKIRVIRAIRRTAFIGVFGFTVLFLLNPKALLSRLDFYTETLSLSSPASELVYRARDYPLRGFLAAFDRPGWPYGYGIGTASLGVQYVARLFGAYPPVPGVENGYGTLVIEFGILGLILWLTMTFAIVLSSWKVVHKLKNSPWFPLAFMDWWIVFLVLFPFVFNGMVSYQNFVTNAYLWLLIGVLFRMPTIALSTQLAAPEPATREFAARRYQFKRA